MKTDYQIYSEKYRETKCKMHIMTYGTEEYKSMNALMNFYYEKMRNSAQTERAFK